MKRISRRVLSFSMAFIMFVTLLPLSVKSDMKNAEAKDQVSSQKEHTFNEEEQNTMTYGLTKHFTNAKKFIDSDFYYNDLWFDSDPSDMSEKLALASIQFSSAASSKETAINHLNNLGFNNTNGVNFDENDILKPAYCYGIKKLSDETTLIAINFQGANYPSSMWESNLSINKDEEVLDYHYGYYSSANAVLSDIVNLAGYGDKKVKYWITGLSRGGAITNIISTLIMDKKSEFSALSDKEVSVYAYTFEAPGTYDASYLEDKNYNYIHNFKTTDDFLCKFPFWNMSSAGNTYYLDKMADSKEALKYFSKYSPGTSKYEAQEIFYNESALEINSGLTAKILKLIPERKDYSRVLKDTIYQLSEQGIPQIIDEVTYSYQKSLVKLWPAILMIANGGGTISFMELLSDEVVLKYFTMLLMAGVSDKYKDMKEDLTPEEIAKIKVTSDSLYYQSALGLKDIFNEKFGTDFDTYNLYGALRILANLLIKEKNVISAYEDAQNQDIENISYFDFIINNTEIAKLSSIKTIITSHFFEVILARLYSIALPPYEDEIALITNDDYLHSSKEEVIQEFKDKAKALEKKYLSVENVQIEGDYEEGKVCYLSADFLTTGHIFSDDHVITLNGQMPNNMILSYEQKGTLATCKWKIEVGTPATYKVTFDVNGMGENPESMELKDGENLGYVKLPELPDVEVDGFTYKAFNWVDEDGNSLSNYIINNDITLTMKWRKIIGKVLFNLDIPEYNTKVEDYSNLVKVSEDADYEVFSVTVANEEGTDITYDDYYEMKEGTYKASIIISLNEEYNIFAGKDGVFNGEVICNNGDITPYSISLNNDADILYVSLTFDVLKPSNPSNPSNPTDKPTSIPAVTSAPAVSSEPIITTTTEPAVTVIPDATSSASPVQTPPSKQTSVSILPTTPVYLNPGDTFTDASSNLIYKVLIANKETNKGKVACIGSAVTTASSISIPNSVFSSLVTYKVTQVGEKAFNGYKELKELILGKNIVKIKGAAFKGCKNLKKIRIKTKKLKKKDLAKSAFKKIAENATIKVPKSKYKYYKKIFKSIGVKIKK